MSDSDKEPKKFQIKLKYKVGTEIHYTTLEKFEFLTIRESNMIDNEKKIVKENMKLPEKWSNNETDFNKLKNHLETEDRNEYKFNIPLSTYYFTFDNLQGFLNQKLGISSLQSNFRPNITDNRERLDTIKELLSKNELAKIINDYIKKQVDTNDSNYFFQFNNARSNLGKLFDTGVLQDSGYLNKGNEIGQGKAFIYIFLYFIFYINLEEYFNSQQSAGELDLTNIDSKASQFLEACNAERDKEKIFVVKSLENMKILLQNLIYLNGLYKEYNDSKSPLPKERIPKIKSLKKIGITDVSKFAPYYKSDSPKFINSDEESKIIFDLFASSGSELKFNVINDIIDRVINDIYKKFGDKIQNIGKEYKNLEHNNSKFFILKKFEKPEYIKEYFEFLEENFKNNEKYKDSRALRYDNNIPKYNTDEGRKQIVKEYGKYILDDEYYENSDIDKLYSKLRSDQRRLSYIITYHNIFKILETFYLVPNNCILHNKFFREIFNQQDGANQIKKSNEKIYMRVKSIKCVKLSEDMLQEAFEDDEILKPTFEIEFEEISSYSNLIFNINLIDKLNPKKQLEDKIKELKQENSKGKKTISEINSEILIYKKYSNNIFSKNKNIDPTKIFFKKELDIKKMVNTFSIIKSNNKIFKSLDVEKEGDALMIRHTFDAIVKEKELINEKNSEEEKNSEDDVAYYIFKYYIERFYFETDTHLFVDGKYAQIKKVRLRLLNKMGYDELENNKFNSTSKEQEKFLDVLPSKTTRLAIDGVDSSYYVYLDVEVVFKNSPTDRIPIKDQINYANNCIGKATVLDRLLWLQLGINYPKRYLENKMRKKNGLFDTTRKKSLVKSIPPAPKTKEEPSSEKSQTGGTNKNLTRKIISKQKNKTMKNLVHYYTI